MKSKAEAMKDDSQKMVTHRNAKRECKELTLLCLIATGMIYFRNPLFIQQPRLFAEEPGYYLLNALLNPLPESFGVTMAGYFSIIPNLAAELAAKAFPLEYAAHIFTTFAFVIQLSTVCSIYLSRGRLLPNKWYAALTAIFMLVIAKPETWMNTVYSMYWLAAGMFFILNTERIRGFHLCYSAVAFLTGPTSLLWLPMFVLRWLWGYETGDKRERSVGIITLMGLIGIVVNAWMLSGDKTTSSLGSRLSVTMLSNLPKGFVSMFAHLFASGPYILPVSIVTLVGGFGLIARKLYKSNSHFRAYSIGALLYYGLITTFLSFEMQGGNRYALPVTAGIFSLATISISDLAFDKHLIRSRWEKPVFICCLALLMGNKLIEFRDFSGTYSKTNYMYDQEWPNWKEQITKLDRSKGGVIQTFPQLGGRDLQGRSWSFVLPGGVGK